MYFWNLFYIYDCQVSFNKELFCVVGNLYIIHKCPFWSMEVWLFCKLWQTERTNDKREVALPIMIYLGRVHHQVWDVRPPACSLQSHAGNLSNFKLFVDNRYNSCPLCLFSTLFLQMMQNLFSRRRESCWPTPGRVGSRGPRAAPRRSWTPSCSWGSSATIPSCSRWVNIIFQRKTCYKLHYHNSI